MATRGNVLDRVTDLLEDKTTVTRSRLESWVGFVLSEMKLNGVLGPDATATVSVVSGTATYNLPTDIDQLDTDGVFIEDNSRPPLIFEPEWRFAARLSDDDDLTGTPEWYTLPKRPTGLAVGTIRLYPVPDAALTLRLNYKANFATLSADSTVLSLTEDKMTTAVWGVYRIWTRIEENQDIKGATEEFTLSIARAKAADANFRPYQVQYRDMGL